MQVVSDGGMRAVLLVHAPLDHEWAKTADEMQGKQWWFETFRADDVAANLRSELAAELATASADAAVRRHAFAVLGSEDARLRAERLVLGVLEEIVARRAVLWDPRLDEVADAAVALRAFWSGVAPAMAAALPAAPVAAPLASTLAQRVGDELLRGMRTEPSDDLSAARALLGPLTEHTLAMQFVWQRVWVQCAAVRDHALRTAVRTKDRDVQHAYAELARQCADVVAAIERLRGH